MTFSVVNVGENRERIVGTIWAAAEGEAEAIARTLFGGAEPVDRVVIRRTEEREIPLRLLN